MPVKTKAETPARPKPVTDDAAEGERAEELEVLSAPPHSAGCSCGGVGGVVRFRMVRKGQKAVIVDYSPEEAADLVADLTEAILRASDGQPS